MEARQLSIPGLWEFTPVQFPDRRGNFLVWYDAAVLRQALGYELAVAQTNHSLSVRGTIRGVHWADVPPGQAKYLYCPRGAALDIVVDLRVGSPTFGRHEAVRLDQEDFRAVFVSEGLGHAFVALEHDTVLTYLCSERYRPDHEHTVNVFDPELDLPWPADVEPVLSDRDRAAPSLKEATDLGLLPTYEACRDHYERLRAG